MVRLVRAPVVMNHGRLTKTIMDLAAVCSGVSDMTR